MPFHHKGHKKIRRLANKGAKKAKTAGKKGGLAVSKGAVAANSFGFGLTFR